MRSKTSLLNKTLFAIDLKQKTLPIGIGLFIVFFVSILLPGMVGGEDEMATAVASLRALFLMTNPVLIALLCILVVIVQYAYMYRRRDSYMLHSFPVSRSAHFFTHALTGFLTLLLLTALSYLFLMVFFNTEIMSAEMLVFCFCETIIQMIFFYSLSLFVVVVCGNIWLAFITFGVLNALWLFVNVFAAEINYLLVSHPIALDYGSTDPFNFFMYEKTDFLFPIYFFLKRVNGVTNLTEGGYIRTDMSDLCECAYMLIPAALLIWLSYFLYKKKNLEHTGEIVAFGWCRVVFRVLFTVCGACLAAIMLYVPLMEGVHFEKGSVSNLLIVMLFLLVGGVIFMFLGEMILQKTVHIFRGKKLSILQSGIALGAVLVYVVLAGFGVFAPAIVPSTNDFAYLQISTDLTGSNEYVITEPEQIEKIVAEQREFVNDPKLLSLAELSRKQELSTDELDKLMKTHRMVVQFMKKDGDDRRTVQVLSYSFNDDYRERLMGSFLSIIRDPKYMAETLIGRDANGVQLGRVYFSDMKDTGNIIWKRFKFTEEKDDFYKTFIWNGRMSNFSEYAPEGNETTKVYTMSNENYNSTYYSLYDAILKDMAQGHIMPYAQGSGVALGDDLTGYGICDMIFEVFSDDGGAWVRFALTDKCENALRELEKLQAV